MELIYKDASHGVHWTLILEEADGGERVLAHAHDLPVPQRGDRVNQEGEGAPLLVVSRTWNLRPDGPVDVTVRVAGEDWRK